jgi:hypothetical protein
MSTSDNPGTSPTRLGEDPSGAPAPGTAPEPGTTTGRSSGPDSPAGARSAARQRDRGDGGRAANMLPGRSRRRFGLERILVRFIATGGVIGIGVALGAILAASKVQGWIIGLVVAAVSVVLSATLWSSRQL